MEETFENFVGLDRSKEDIKMWVEKYRPTNLDDYIGNESFVNNIKDYIKRGELTNHVLFHGPQGTGKTTIAKLLIKNIPCDSLFVCASDETSIENIRDKVRGFASSVGFNKFKIVLMDECLDENTIVYVLRSGVETGVPIKDLDFTSDLVKSFNIKKNVVDWKPFYLWDMGTKDVVEMELENGETVVCTLDHKWHVLDDNGEMIKVKTKEILDGKYEYILSPE